MDVATQIEYRSEYGDLNEDIGLSKRQVWLTTSIESKIIREGDLHMSSIFL